MDDEEAPSRLSIDSWRDGAPALTDAATSISSSSLCTALSGQVENGDPSIVTASTSAQSLNSANGAVPLNAAAAGGTFFTPQNYKNVRPLAAAFMSTGLVSKRSRPRNGSLSGAPVFNLHQHLQQQLGEGPAPPKGSPMKAPTADAGAPLPNPMVTSLSRHSMMPDTPVKRSAFQAGAGLNSSARPPLAVETPTVKIENVPSSEGIQESPTAAALASGSPVGAGGVLSEKQTAALSLANEGEEPRARRGSLSPLAEGAGAAGAHCQSPLGRSSVSPSSSSTAGTGDMHPPMLRAAAPSCDVSPSLHAFKSGSRFGSASMRSGLGRVRPALFRRRSSGQLSAEGGFHSSNLRSGGSSSGKSSATGTIGEGEPMTPTRSVGGRHWEGKRRSDCVCDIPHELTILLPAASQLLDTPTEEAPITPALSTFPDLPTHAFAPSNQHSVFIQPLATPHGAPRASFPLSDQEHRARGEDVPGPGRPQFKIRHSSSTVLSLRQQELSQPSRFETDYTLLRNLGNGEFSDAWEVQDHTREGKVYAVKRTKQPFLGPKDRWACHTNANLRDGS